MKKINSLFLKEGSTLEDAMSMFKVVIDANEISDYTVKDWNTVSLSYLTDPEGWLSIWMLKSDELASAMLDCRLWDAVYLKDGDCVQNIGVRNRSSIEEEGDVIDTYDNFPLASEKLVPLSLRLLIVNAALVETLILFEDTREVDIKPVKGFYNLSKDLEDGEFLPYQDKTRIMSGILNKHVMEMNKNQSLEINAIEKLIKE